MYRGRWQRTARTCRVCERTLELLLFSGHAQCAECRATESTKTKCCRACGVTKSVVEFDMAYKAMKTGQMRYNARCKACLRPRGLHGREAQRDADAAVRVALGEIGRAHV